MASVEEARDCRVGVLIGDESAFMSKNEDRLGVEKNVSEEVGETRLIP